MQGHRAHQARPAPPPGLHPVQDRRRIQRRASRTVHRIARKIRDGRQAAARYQREDNRP